MNETDGDTTQIRVIHLDLVKVSERENNEMLGVPGPMKSDSVESTAMGNK